MKDARNHFCNFSIALLLSLSTAQAHAGESYGNPEDPVVAEVLGMQIRTKSPAEMQSVIGEKLFQNYARQNKIEASQEDIDLYMTKMDQFMRDDPLMRDERNKREARKVEIQQQLKAGTIPAEQKKQL
jgi:methionine-rich copper-binding protein CopC